MESIGSIADFKQGMSTTDAERFVRRWMEVPLYNINFTNIMVRERAKWFPFNKGGIFENGMVTMNFLFYMKMMAKTLSH